MKISNTSFAIGFVIRLNKETKKMSLFVIILLCFLFIQARGIQGFQFSMDTTSGNGYCGHFLCAADINHNDSDILSITGMDIVKVHLSGIQYKLGSISVFNPHPFVDPSKINTISASGNISETNASLTLRLRDDFDCLSGRFLCELKFVDITGEPAVMRKEVSRKFDIFPSYILTKISTSIQELSVTQQEMLKNETEEITRNIQEKQASLEAQLNTILVQQTVIIDLLNSSRATDEVKSSCYRGKLRTKSRKNIILWDTVSTLCDTVTDGGGWIIIQRRTSGDVDFYRGWEDYKTGFGATDTDFWIGNDVIHKLTLDGYNELRVDMKTNHGSFYAHYKDFRVADEMSKYQLNVSGYSGNKTDSLACHNGMFFTTFDRDNDYNYFSQNCAIQYLGAWWYNNCFCSHLNGIWKAHNNTGVIWGEGGGFEEANSLSFTEMKIRKVLKK